MKKLIPSLCLLLISAMLLGTSTYAWFSMNTQVTATGMQVKAQAEGGIVITNSQKSSWTASANAQVLSASLFPTSNAKAPTGNWYHASSDKADNYAKAESLEYETLTTAYSSTNGEGIAYVENGENSAYDAGVDSAYWLMNKFFIKSSGDVLTQPLYINKVTATSSGTALAIDNALRVLVVVNNAPFLYAPVSVGDGPTLSYKVAGNSSNTTALAGTVINTATEVSTIGNTDATAIPVEIYVYYEGEDVNCKSTNISGITVDDITVSVQFGTTQISAPAEPEPEAGT